MKIFFIMEIKLKKIKFFHFYYNLILNYLKMNLFFFKLNLKLIFLIINIQNNINNYFLN